MMTFILTKRSLLLFLLILGPVSSFPPAGSGQRPAPSRLIDAKQRASVATDDDSHKDFSGEAAGLFGNIRVPAALFAGAAAAQAYAMPVTAVNDGLMLGFAKRLYAFLMIGSLAAQSNTILIATMTMGSLSGQSDAKQATSLVQWMQQYYDSEWTTVKFNFISGIVCFSLAAALRAKLTMMCPVIATACVGILVSSTLLSLAFVDDVEGTVHDGQGLLNLPLHMFQVTLRQCRKSPLFFLAALSYAFTYLFVAIKIPHLYVYLASAGK